MFNIYVQIVNVCIENNKVINCNIRLKNVSVHFWLGMEKSKLSWIHKTTNNNNDLTKVGGGGHARNQGDTRYSWSLAFKK